MRLKQEAEIILDKIQALEELDRQVRELVDLPPRKGTSFLDEGAGSVGGGDIPGGIPGAVDSPPRNPQGEEAPSSARALDSSVDEWSKVLREVATDFDGLNSLLEQQVANLERLKTVVISRRQYLAALPTRWPVRGIITSRFGYRKSPFGGGKEFHDGLDIAANMSTPIVAAGSGRIIFTGWLAGYGRTVILDHGYGYRTQYSHASSILVKKGQRVKKGDAIARVGSTGRSTGPHLHFMVSVNGKLVDPLEVLP
ncbi:MAG: M23 family metallopeptidase [Firmicutes bacterium]|nr:M23 family metallopeptidase [Bacillota bacterium]